LRKAFTLIELLVIIGIMGLMVTVGIVNVRSGQGAARTRGAARDIFAVIRHARSTALVTVQPAVITYSCVMEDEEPVAKIEIHSAKILGGNIDAEKLQTLSGEPVKTAEQDAKAETPAPENKDEEPTPEQGKADGESLEDVLFAPISTEIVKGMRLKVVMGDDEAEFADAQQRKPKISVFSNVDYLLGKFKGAKETAKQEEEKMSGVKDEAASADGDLQKDVSVVWEPNGRTDPHQVWIYPDGSEPQKGLLIKIDRFGGVKVLSGDGREDEE
jgi:type II secretory pathway pseudopilin PulG